MASNQLSLVVASPAMANIASWNCDRKASSHRRQVRRPPPPYSIASSLVIAVVVIAALAGGCHAAPNRTISIIDRLTNTSQLPSTGRFDPCPLRTAFKLSDYNQKEVCESIDLVNPQNFSSIANYAHCRVVNGYVILRHTKLTLYDTTELWFSFPNLEVITDFLVLYDIKAKGRTVSLNTVFPRLRLVAGERRFSNRTVFIEKFHADDQLELDQLQEVCGPFYLRNSVNVCFRYSPLYWRLVPHVNWTDLLKRRFPMLERDNVLIRPEQEDKQHVFARLKVNLKLTNETRHKWSKLYMARMSIFQMDLNMYQHLQGNPPCPTQCSPKENTTHDIALADVVHFDYLNTFDAKFAIDHLKGDAPLDKYTFFDNVVKPEVKPLVTLKPEWGFLKAHFDIRSIYHSSIPKTQLHETEMDEYYGFTYDRLYLIKVMACYGPLIWDCDLTQYHKLFFSREMFPHPVVVPPPPQTSPLAFSTTIGSNVTTTTNSLESLTQATGWVQQPLHLAIAGLVVAVILCSILLYRYRHTAVLCFRSRLKRYKASVVSVNPEYTPISSVWSWDPFSTDGAGDDVSYEISRSRLTILHQRLLGKGEFGAVHEGILFLDEPSLPGTPTHCTAGGRNSMRVAVKQLRENAQQIDKEKFITEARYMKSFNSNFLVKLIGVCTLQEPLLVVMEYMENGDLKTYLRSKYQDYQERHNFAVMPTFDSTIRMAIQIADGMYYLHSKRVIHRDLAARNCMVAGDLTVKIGDFGLTRHVYESDYYRLSSVARVPLRWMAPESVRKQIFTPQTDVWSYGVILWEIMTFGEQPYKGKTDHEVKEMLRHGERLPRPTYYTQLIWDLAKRCWAKNPHGRPSFRQIVEFLYPHLNSKQQVQFDQLSFYSSNKARQPFAGFSLPQMITERCFDFLSKFCHQHPQPSSASSVASQQQQKQQLLANQMVPYQGSIHSGYAGSTVCSQQSCQTAVSCCAPVTCGATRAQQQPNGGGLHRHGSFRSSLGRGQQQQALSPSCRPRCTSFDSLQSTGGLSDATTFTMISSSINSGYEPSIQSRHNSAGSNTSAGSSSTATTNNSEHIPLINQSREV